MEIRRSTKSSPNPTGKPYSIGDAFNSGLRTGLNWQLLRLMTSFFLICLAMVLALLTVAAVSFASRLQSLFSLPINQAFSYLLTFGLGLVIAGLILFIALLAASQWITVFSINISKTLREKGRVTKAALAAAQKTASEMLWRMLALAVFLALASVLVNLAADALSDGTFLSSLFYGIIAALVTFSLACAPYRLSLGGIAKGRVAASLWESVRLFLLSPPQVAMSVVLAEIVSLAAIVIALLPLALVVAGLVSIALSAGLWGASFWLNLLLLVPSVAFAAFGLAFAKLFSIGALECTNSLLWPKVVPVRPKA